MKKLLLLTGSFCIFTACYTYAQPNVFDPADPIVYYPSSAPATNWGNIQKWVVTDRNLGWNTASYKAYHLNGVSFRLKFPKTYQHNVADGRKYPIMIFWHGAGEKGWLYDNETHLVHGGEIFRDRVDNGVFDGFVMYPQNSGGYFDNSHFEIVIKVVDSLAKYCKLDIDRVLVNGASAGGDACFNITATYPHRITKATPSAAAPASAIPYVGNFVHVPVWFASGGLDVNPTLAMAQTMYDSLKNRGADVKWTLYPDRGHYMWISHWFEPGYDEYINDMHKANPLVYFQRNLFCPDSPTVTKMGLSAGFSAYEWQVNKGSGYTSIAGATLNEYTATSYGTYRVRFKRSSTANWSEWSPSPVVVGPKTTTITPPINVKGLRSKVLPAPDGSTSVPLRLPPGYAGYEYWRTADNLLVGTDSVFDAIPGTYKARVSEEFGCNAFFSPDFTVVYANGFNKPHAAKNLVAFAPNQTSRQLDWSDNPNPAFDETGFEIYRAEQAGGPFTLIAINAPNVLSYLDQNLPPNTSFYYIVRAVNNSGAAPNSNEASAKTKADNNPPTAPGNLRNTLAGRFSVSLAWDPSTDDAAVAHYDVYVNGTKRYTTEGTSFTVNELDSFQRYTFAVIAKDIRGNQSPFSNQVNVTTKNQGFFYQYYEGTWTALPDFSNLSPISETGNTSNIDLSVRNRNDNFAFIWRGYITVPTTATYTFETCSDEGSKLYVNMPYSHSAVPTVSNDFIHATTCQTGSVALIAGISYPITATFFEASGGEAMQLYWRNNAGLARQLIPNSALNDSYTPTGTAPTAPSALIANTTGANRIALSWNDNSNNESGFEIVRATAAAGPFVNIGNTNAGINNYIDSTLNASTTYWFKVRAIGSTGESAFSTASFATTQALPAIPNPPALLTAEVISASVINLSWNDNSANETSFEIYRSTSNNTNFRVITTINGGSGNLKAFTDTGLFANVRYYYKIRAVGPGGQSAYTNEANGKTVNTRPVVTDVQDFTIRHSIQYELALSATDTDGDLLTFSSDNLPYFASIVHGANGSAQIIFNPDIGDEGGYFMTVYVTDGNGGADTTYLSFLVNDNFPPTLQEISNIQINEGATLTLNLTANDNEAPQYIGWGFTGLPSFASFSHNGNGQGTLQLNPGYAASGVYNVSLMVDDGFGAWIARSFTITVNEKDPNEKILVSIKNATTAPEPWNNMGSQSILNLKNTDGITTTVDAAVANSWQFNLNNLGAQTGDDSGIYPDAVMKDGVHWGYFLGNNTVDNSTLTISGLNPTRRYTLVFFGSSVYNLYPDNGITTYQVGAVSVSLGVQGNTSNKVAINDITPTAGGTITVQMIGDPHPDLGGWLNAFEIINQYDDGTIPARPTNLAGVFVEHKGTKLNWNDVAYNETRYKIYRSTNLAGPYTLLNPSGNNANTITYSDATAVPATQYYYYLTASNGIGDSGPGDTVSVLTGNNSPLINNLQNIFVKTGNVTSEPFTVTDNAGDIVSVTTADMPSFVTLQSLGGTSYQLVANPGNDFIGLHKMKVVVSDNKGGTNSQTITVQVADKRTRSFYINFGTDDNSSSAPWNDFVGFTYAGKQLLNLKDEAGVTTGYRIRIDSSWTTTFNLGYMTGNNSGVYIDSVLKGGVLSNHSLPRRITFAGLDPTKKYNVAFIGSSNNGITASADYSATGAVTTSLNARYNQYRLAYLNGLSPAGGSNSIQVSITKQAGSPFMYLNGIVLEEYADTVLVMNPVHLFVEVKDKSSVVLMWADRTNVENGYEVYRATNANGPWTLITTTAANVTTYTNTNLTPNTKYWYRVRAKRNTGPAFSDYSNTVATITPKSVIFVNLTFTYPASSPWNNTNVNPEAGKTFSDLLNDGSQSTGITMTITKAFNGQNDAGMQTANGIFPVNVMRSNYWLDRSQAGQLRLSGLNHSKRYRIGFFGSIGPGWDGNFVSTYTIGNRTVYLNAYRNETNAVYIGDVVPDENGEVFLNVSTTAEANFGFTGAIIIQSYDDATGGTVLSIPNGDDVIEPIASLPDAPVENEGGGFSIAAYPNPFTDNVKIDFNNTSPANQVSIEIIDLTGRLMYRKDAGKVAAGKYTLRLDLSRSSFAPGVYIVRLTINGRLVRATRLIKLKK